MFYHSACCMANVTITQLCCGTAKPTTDNTYTTNKYSYDSTKVHLQKWVADWIWLQFLTLSTSNPTVTQLPYFVGQNRDRLFPQRRNGLFKVTLLINKSKCGDFQLLTLIFMTPHRSQVQGLPVSVMVLFCLLKLRDFTLNLICIGGFSFLLFILSFRQVKRLQKIRFTDRLYKSFYFVHVPGLLHPHIYRKLVYQVFLGKMF